MLVEFDFNLSQTDYEKFLKQEGQVYWLYGLSGSGKSTLANELCKYFFSEKRFAIILDGDSLRKTLNKDLGFSEEDRTENLRRMAEMAKFLAQKGVIVIASFITPLIAQRKMISQILKETQHQLVFIDSDIETCMKRDPKGIYKSYQEGKIQGLTGMDAPFEIGNPSVQIDTSSGPISSSLDSFIKTLIH